jgi:hypothetical protein
MSTTTTRPGCRRRAMSKIFFGVLFLVATLTTAVWSQTSGGPVHYTIPLTGNEQTSLGYPCTVSCYVVSSDIATFVLTGHTIGPSITGTVTLQSGTTATLANLNCGTEVVFTNASAVTVTIPATLPIGCNIAILQAGASKVSVNGSAVAAATLESAHSYTGTSAQWAIIGVNIEANSGGSAAIAVLTGDGA